MVCRTKRLTSCAFFQTLFIFIFSLPPCLPHFHFPLTLAILDFYFPMKSYNISLASGSVFQGTRTQPRWNSGKESICQCWRHKRCGFELWVRKIPWSRTWQPTPVFLPGESQGQKSLVGCRLRGCTELVTNEATQHAVCIGNIGLPGWRSGKESTCQCRRCQRRGLNPWVSKIPCRRTWQPTPVFLPGESHGQRSLAGYSPWGRKRVRHNLATKQQFSPKTDKVMCALFSLSAMTISSKD